MIGALGAEIDRLEAEIRQLVPGIRHIDLVLRSAFWPAAGRLSFRDLACDETALSAGDRQGPAPEGLAGHLGPVHR